MNLQHYRRGLGAVEWAVVAGLIAIALVLGVEQLGTKVNQHLENTSNNFLGDGSSPSEGDSFWGSMNGSGDAEVDADSGNDQADQEAGNQDDSDNSNDSPGKSKGRGRGR